MEYTKDIAFEIACKSKIGYMKLKSGTSFLKEKIKTNKLVFGVLSLLSLFILTDLILVHSFLQLLSSLY